MYEAKCKGCQQGGWDMVSVSPAQVKDEAEKHLDGSRDCKWIAVFMGPGDNMRPMLRLSRRLGGGLLELPLIGEDI